MQEKAIPSFLGPNKLSFVVLAPILGIFVVAVSRAIHSWDKIQPHLGRLILRHDVGRPRTTGIELVPV